MRNVVSALACLNVNGVPLLDLVDFSWDSDSPFEVFLDLRRAPNADFYEQAVRTICFF